MELQAPTLQSLFAQLGEPDDEAAITRFVETHGPIRGHIPLHEAPFWTRAQATFLSEAISHDAHWAAVVDALNVSLHAGPRANPAARSALHLP